MKAVNGNTAFFITFVLYKIKFMKRVLFLVSLWGILLFVTACSSLQPVSYERLQPADVSFPTQIQKVGIVNNMPVVHQDYKKVDYISASLEGDGEVATESLAQEVVSVNYFDQVVMYEKKIRKSTYPLDQPISKEMVDDLIRILDVDMLLAMERVNVELKESIIFIPELYATVPAVDGIVTSVVRAYLKQREEPLFTVQKTDTLCWEITPKLTYGDVVKDVSNNIYDKKKGKAKMRAAYNLAVYSEMKDDFEYAKEYLATACALADEGSWEHQLILFYQMKLEEERKKNLRLNVQMKRFEP